MTMMIKSSEAECRDGMSLAELRYQQLAKALSESKPNASVHRIERRMPRVANPTGRTNVATEQPLSAASR